jgi:hypothetical protein
LNRRHWENSLNREVRQEARRSKQTFAFLRVLGG